MDPSYQLPRRKCLVTIRHISYFPSTFYLLNEPIILLIIIAYSNFSFSYKLTNVYLCLFSESQEFYVKVVISEFTNVTVEFYRAGHNKIQINCWTSRAWYCSPIVLCSLGGIFNLVLEDKLGQLWRAIYKLFLKKLASSSV